MKILSNQQLQYTIRLKAGVGFKQDVLAKNNSGYYITNNAFNNQFLINNTYLSFLINETDATTKPYFKNLMEYDVVNDEELGLIPTALSNNIVHPNDNYVDLDVNPNKFLGESFINIDYVVTKLVFDSSIMSAGYNYWLFYGTTVDDEAFNTDDWKIYIDLTNPPIKPNYGGHSIITLLDISNNSLGIKVDNIIATIHDTNYNNPHASQVATIPSLLRNNSMMTPELLDTITDTPNGCIVGNHLISKTGAMQYLGDFILDEYQFPEWSFTPDDGTVVEPIIEESDELEDTNEEGDNHE